jgi:hypothetical protein
MQLASTGGWDYNRRLFLFLDHPWSHQLVRQSSGWRLAHHNSFNRELVYGWSSLAALRVKCFMTRPFVRAIKLVRRFVLKPFSLPALCLFILGIVLRQQVSDPDFKTTVAYPAYTRTHLRVLFDEAHNNFHSARGRFKGFTELITNDGYRVTTNKEEFSERALKGYDILVIANPLNDSGDVENPMEDRQAFTEAECDAVRDWARAGGALLLIVDHAPWGAAARNLAKRFDVDMSNSYARDLSNYDRDFGALS